MKRNLLMICLASLLVAGCAGGSWGTGVKPKTFGPKEDESIGKLPLRDLQIGRASDCSEEELSKSKADCRQK